MKIKRLTVVAQREFTNAQVLEETSGLITKALDHILKLRLGLNYERDQASHKSDICTEFLGPVLGKIEKDRSKKTNSEEVVRLYLEDFNIKSYIKKMSSVFMNKYGMKRKLTEDDVNFAINDLKFLMEKGITYTEMRRRVQKIVPEL